MPMTETALAATPPPAQARRRRPLDAHGQYLLLVVLLGFIVRLAWLLFALRAPVGGGDAQFYLQTARSIAAGQGYEVAGQATALWPPGYSFVLGGALWSMPFDDIAVAGALNLVLGTATIALVGLLARRLLGPRSAIAAAGIVALFPSMVMFTSSILTETLCNLLVVAMLTVLMWHPWRSADGSMVLPSVRRVAVAGGLAGAAMLVRPPIVASVLLIPVAWAVARAARRGSALRIGVLVGAMAVVVLPWTVRNALRMDAFVPVSNNTGINLCIGNNPEANGGFGVPVYCFGDLPTAQTSQGEVERDRALRQRATDWILEHPQEQLRLVPLRTYTLFANDSAAVVAAESFGNDPWLDLQHAQWLRWWADTYFWMVFTLASFGFVVWLRRRDPRVVALLMVAVGVVVITWPFFGDGRFKQPMLPVLALAATVSLRRLLVERERESAPT